MESEVYRSGFVCHHGNLESKCLYCTEVKKANAEVSLKFLEAMKSPPVVLHDDRGGGILCPHGEDYCPKCIQKHAEDNEEVRTLSSTGGIKGTKLARFDLLPVGPLTELAKHYGRGCAKYADRNWELGYEWSKSYASLQRHANAFWGGEDIDPETGTPHIIAVAWHALALAEFMNRYPEFDDRSK